MSNLSKNYEVLRLLDEVAREANSLWHRTERVKMILADHLNVTTEQMRIHGIHVGESTVPKRDDT